MGQFQKHPVDIPVGHLVGPTDILSVLAYWLNFRHGGESVLPFKLKFYQMISMILRVQDINPESVLPFKLKFYQMISTILRVQDINPEYSLEGLMLKLKLQYFDHLM